MTAQAEGWTAPGFESVREVFEGNLASGAELGASFSAYHRGEPVVDLWGGIADEATGRPWTKDTIALVWSTTKGITATCANRLADEGAIDVRAPVARYWPDFARNGKDEITVEHILSHQAGLAWVDGEMTAEEVFSWDPVVAALEDQAPHWVPGERHGYHATTYGWLVGEVIRRVCGVSVGTYLQREIAEPLGLDMWIGLPAEQEPRVATLTNMFGRPTTIEDLADPGDDPVLQVMAQFLGPETTLGKSLFAPGMALADTEIWNTPALRAAEIPAANGVTNARSLARMFAACIGEVDGIRLLRTAQLEDAITQRTEGPNHVLFDLDLQFGLGYMLRSSLITLGGERSFGHYGLGGSMGWADPDSQLAFGYVMNKLDLGITGDARSHRLVAACYEALS